MTIVGPKKQLPVVNPVVSVVHSNGLPGCREYTGDCNSLFALMLWTAFDDRAVYRVKLGEGPCSSWDKVKKRGGNKFSMKGRINLRFTFLSMTK